MGRHLDEGPRGSGVQVIFVSEVAVLATVLHQPLIEPDGVKWHLADQGAATVLNRAAQAALQHDTQKRTKDSLAAVNRYRMY